MQAMRSKSIDRAREISLVVAGLVADDGDGGWLGEAALVRSVAAAVVVLARLVQRDAAPRSGVADVELLAAEVSEIVMLLGLARRTARQIENV